MSTLKIVSGIVLIVAGIVLLLLLQVIGVFLVILGIGLIVYRKDENKIEEIKDIRLNNKKTKR